MRRPETAPPRPMGEQQRAVPGSSPPPGPAPRPATTPPIPSPTRAQNHRRDPRNHKPPHIPKATQRSHNPKPTNPLDGETADQRTHHDPHCTYTTRQKPTASTSPHQLPPPCSTARHPHSPGPIHRTHREPAKRRVPPHLHSCQNHHPHAGHRWPGCCLWPPPNTMPSINIHIIDSPTPVNRIKIPHARTTKNQESIPPPTPRPTGAARSQTAIPTE
ncbi:proline-rich protein 2-like [Micropterus salmoides]|uniref:proline-rich protein 2-like n=1 Tax=Micropterus salmoides TaxID=27706 RepID=UPI0018EA7515|nr:proline-rich protein 2-like [Micropterus salmoides]